MRIRVIGTCDAAKVLRKKLPVAGFVVGEDLPDYTITLEDSTDLETKDPVVLVDSIPCQFETNVCFHISKLTKTDIRISRQGGQVFTDTSIRVVIPLKVEDSNAVEIGVLRALLDLGRGEPNPSAPPVVTEEVKQSPWYKKLPVLKKVLPLFLLSVMAYGQGTQPTGQLPTKVNIVSISGTTVTAGGGFPVTCVAGCGGAASFPDSSAFTFATTPVNNMSAVVDDVGTNTVAENSAGAVRMNGNRILYVDLSKTAVNATAFKVDGSAVVQPVSGTVTANAGSGTFTISGTVTTTPPANASTNVSQFGGAAVVTGTGVGGAGIPRVTVSSDSFPATQAVSGTVTTTPPSNASSNVSQFGGSVVVTGTGVGGAGIPRVTVSSDSFPATQAVSGTVTANAGSGTFAVSGTVTTTPPANASTNIAQINGVTPLMGNGVTGTGSQRVTIASDNTAFAVNATLQTGANVIGSLTANQSVNAAQISGTTTLTGNGVTGAGSQRVTIASDNTAFSVNAVQSGTWTVQPGNTPNTTPWLTAAAGNGTVLSGQQAVTGTAAALATNTVKRVCVKAANANALNVFVGATGVTTATGFELAAGQALCLPVTNTNLLFVIASTTGASVSWSATN